MPPLPAAGAPAGARDTLRGRAHRARPDARCAEAPLTRLEGDPGPLGWLRFTYGFRLPPENVHWVRHELTDAGWRRRTVLRHLAVVIPICAILVTVLAILLPAPIWVSLTMVALILCGSLFTVTAYADDLRVNRLRQHDLPVPKDPDLGRPSH